MKNDTTLYKISIKGEGIDLNKEINSSQLSKVISIVLSTSSNLSNDENLENTIIKPNTPNVPIREYLDNKSSKSNPQKIVAFASYWKEILGKESFSPEEIKMQFEKARESIPSNFSRDFKLAIDSGWISPTAANLGRYFITVKGDILAKDNFKSSSSNASKKNVGGLKKKTIVRDEISSIELTPDLEGFKSYWYFAKKSDRILWLLVAAKQKGIDGVNFKELSALSHKVGDNIEAGGVTALIQSHVKSHFVYTPLIEGNRFLKVLGPGINFIKKVSKDPGGA